ncbi:MAG: hypothetical protein FWD36_05705 [Treponema sp.]|nr:hypothetical protein [Treponema sp.]
MTQHNDIPISIDPTLMEVLTPNSYLASMGITREQREANIRQLAQSVIKPADASGNLQTQIQFMVTRGPFVKEEFLTVNLSRKDGAAAIVLSLAAE